MSVKVNLKICVPYLYVTELYRRSATSDTNCSNQKPTVLKHLNSLRVSPPLNQLQLLTMLIRGPNHWAKLQELSTSRHLSLSPHAVSLLHLSAPRHWKKASAAHQMDRESHYFTGPWRFHVKLFSGINTRKNIWHILITVCQLTCDFWLWIQARRLDVITLSSIPTRWSENSFKPIRSQPCGDFHCCLRPALLLSRKRSPLVWFVLVI